MGMHTDFDGEIRKLSATLQKKSGAVLPRFPSMGGESLLVLQVKQAADKFCSKEEAIKSLIHVYAAIKNYRFNSDITELYTIHPGVSEGEPPDAAAIGCWLDNLEGRHGYFAAPRRATKRHRRYVTAKPGPALAPGAVPPGSLPPTPNRQFDYVDVDQDVVSGFTVTVDIPLNYLLVRLSPRYASAAPAECYVVALLSRTHLRLFWGFSHFHYLDWERTVRIGTVDWSTEEIPLRDTHGLEQAAERLCERFSDFVEGQLRAEYGVPTVAANAAE